MGAFSKYVGAFVMTKQFGAASIFLRNCEICAVALRLRTDVMAIRTMMLSSKSSLLGLSCKEEAYPYHHLYCSSPPVQSSKTTFHNRCFDRIRDANCSLASIWTLRVLVLPLLCFDSHIDNRALIKPQLGLFVSPDPCLLLFIVVGAFEKHPPRHIDVVEELSAHLESALRAFLDDTGDDLSFERPEDDHAELDVDIDIACAMADQAVGCFK